MSNSLENARILVIGGSSGIGLATAIAAAAAGASVTIASRSKVKLEAAIGRIHRTPRFIVLDTREEVAVDDLFRREAPWDHVVVSAAQTTTGSTRALGLRDARAAMESQFWGAYRVSRVAQIKEGGSLTFISGFLSTGEGRTQPCVSMAAVRSLDPPLRS
jgi:NAD(P)-dependent dehydrogenase (short-subunit alcohol dehydrogenase family)